MSVLPPGTLLQLMYLRKRIRQVPPGRFIEIGPGSGEITKLLLDNGWSGCSFDLEARTIEMLKNRFAKEIAEQRFIPINENYLSSAAQLSEKVDLVISSMVMEHLEDDEVSAFMQISAYHLNNEGIMIGIVPASPAHWGIEDDIAGHCRRYTRSAIETLAAVSNWKLQHIAGLTFPISNLLLPVSNFLVNRSERSKLGLSALERTKQSGRRQVKFKTHFPSVLRIFLNEYALFPLYLLQKLFSKSERALVIYFEVKPDSAISEL
jgi:SAM-dependent methyltransferase